MFYSVNKNTNNKPYDYLEFKHNSRNNDGKSYLGIIKIKDILFKCFPDIRIPIKNGIAIKKIMENYTLRNLPQFELSNHYF